MVRGKQMTVAAAVVGLIVTLALAADATGAMALPPGWPAAMEFSVTHSVGYTFDDAIYSLDGDFSLPWNSGEGAYTGSGTLASFAPWTGALAPWGDNQTASGAVYGGPLEDAELDLVWTVSDGMSVASRSGGFASASVIAPPPVPEPAGLTIAAMIFGALTLRQTLRSRCSERHHF